MKAATLMRTGSGPVRPALAGRHDACGVSFPLRRSGSIGGGGAGGFLSSPPRSLHFDSDRRHRAGGSLRRVRSEANLVGSDGGLAEQEVVDRGVLSFGVYTGTKSPMVVPEEEEVVVELSCGGNGAVKGRKTSGEKGDGDGGDRIGMAAYYQEMLKADPGNPLLLRNYGRFLHEVEGDVEGAEECYGRAILASPGDGEVLSLYGKLIWDAHRDEDRAGDYFERAVEASPDDCHVLGSYAHFLWDAEEEENEGDEKSMSTTSQQQHPLVKVY